MLPERIELKSLKIEENIIKSIKIEIGSKEIAKEEELKMKPTSEINEEKDKELRKIETTTPETITFSQIPMESFEVEVDMVNHLSTSGAIENFHLAVHDKPLNS